MGAVMVATAGFSMFCAFGGVASSWGNLSYQEQAEWERQALPKYRPTVGHPYPNRRTDG